MIAIIAALLLSADGGPACSYSLCGDPYNGELGCSCNHGHRCWDDPASCEADAACVEADPKNGLAVCAAKVKAARKKKP